jgi:transposase
LQIELSPGQMHDAPMAELLPHDLPEGTDVPADKRYDADWIRELIEDQGCTPVIPPKSNSTEDIPFSKHKYRKRNLVERCINKLKQFRHIPTRYDRKASAYLAFAKLATVRLCSGFMSLRPNIPVSAGDIYSPRGPFDGAVV